MPGVTKSVLSSKSVKKPSVLWEQRVRSRVAGNEAEEGAGARTQGSYNVYSEII